MGVGDSTTGRAVSVIVPTFQEAENLPTLCARLEQLRAEHALDLELLVMDDDSADGSLEWAGKEAPAWVRFVVRTTDRGLSPAVVEGIGLARNPLLVVMDADLSHPPEKIPEMLARLEEGYELVIGSRRVAGATTDEEWSWLRAVNSWVATVLARPLTGARDPMAGFLAFRRSLTDGVTGIDPIGFKIGLELIVKCRVERVHEVPIHFADRQAGKSKLNLREQWLYLRHLARLYRYRLRRR